VSRTGDTAGGFGAESAATARAESRRVKFRGGGGAFDSKGAATFSGKHKPGGGGVGAEPGCAVSAHGKVWALIMLVGRSLCMQGLTGA